MSLAALAGLVVPATMTVVADGPSRRPSPTTAGTQSPGAGRMPSVSGDGQYVAFIGRPAADADAAETVLLLDRELDAVTDLLPLPANIVPGNSAWPVLSADGCTVTVVTELALDRYRDIEGGGRWDAYQRRIDHCGGSELWELVSGGDGAGLSAEATNDVEPSTAPAVSADGSVVAYAYRVRDADTTSVAVVDTRADVGATSRRRDITAGSGTAVLDPTLDGGGNLLAATVSSDNGNSSRVLIWDLSDGASAAPTTVPGSGRSSQPALSGDGSAMAFVSDAPDIVATGTSCADRCTAQVYIYDFDTDSIDIASRLFTTGDDTLVAGNGASTHPVLSDSGDEVVFITRATNFFVTRHRALGALGEGELVRVILPTGSMRREVRDSDGVAPMPRVHGSPAMSGNGRVVATDTAPRAGARDRMLAITVVEPRLDVDALSFGTIQLGFTSAVVTATISNRGPSSFAPASASSASPDVGIVGGSCVDPLADPVPPGSSCTLEVTFSPGALGLQAIPVTVEEAIPGGVVLEIPALGAGGDEILLAEPAVLTVPPTVVGVASAPVAVLLQNIGGSRVRVGGPLVSGEHAADFRVVVDECVDRRLRAGETCRIEVAFVPGGQGARRAVLSVASTNGGFIAVPLAGTGRYRPTLVAAPVLASRAGDEVAIARAGMRLTVAGTGFAPSTEVLVGWADGYGRSVRVATDASGAFRIRLAVLPGERLGLRTLVASAVGHSAVLRLRLVPGPR